jgi:hypothetical protein
MAVSLLGIVTCDCKLKKFHEMSLTTLAHNQHDVIDVIWRLPVWNVKIIRYLVSCTLQFWYYIDFQNVWYIIFVICIFHSTRVNLRATVQRASAGRICHLENVKFYMLYLQQQCTTKTSFGAKPNVLQFCPLSNFYVVQLLWEIIFIYSFFIHEVYCDIHH